MDVLSRSVTFFHHWDEDFISLTDIARHRDTERGDYIIQNWMRNRNSIEFLGIWEQLNNPDFNSIEFDGIRKQAGLNSFSLTPKRWISTTGAIGIIAKTGRYGGTFAHKDIAFEFASWVSVEFKLYLIKGFQRLKDEEQKQLGWDIKRNLVKINYRIHTDPERVCQVLLNLYMNALNAMDSNGILEVGVADAEEHLEIRVADNGCGIQAKDLEKIFDPYFTTRAKGTGLGLSIVHRIVENLKGEIRVESQPSKGTVFYITLPDNEAIE